MSAVNFKNLRNMMVDESLNWPGSQRFNSNVRTFARHATIRERDFSENNQESIYSPDVKFVRTPYNSGNQVTFIQCLLYQMTSSWP